MFSKADTELLTRTDAGTPTGELVRRFWIPALASSAVAEPNGTPVRVRLAGQNFIAWRDGAGKLGFLDEYCPHRGASLALGKPEGDGLRCIYHGWKFATDGRTLETPNCLVANFKERVKAKVYPLREAGGLVWVYLGPKSKEPPFPHYRFFDVPTDELVIFNAKYDCNFVQFMEGTLDPSHAMVLHQDEGKLGKRYTNKADRGEGDREAEIRSDGPKVQFTAEDNAPECEAEDLSFGVHGIAKFAGLSTEGEPVRFARTHTWVMPFMAVPNQTSFVISVPEDDTHTSFFFVGSHLRGPENAEARARFHDSLRGPASFYDGDRYKLGENETWGQDREAYPDSFTGIEGVVPEDAACVVSMGPIYDRSHEHLTPADALIAQMRRRMLRAARELQAGTEPYMLKPEEATTIGAEWGILPADTPWQDYMTPTNVPFRTKALASVG